MPEPAEYGLTASDVALLRGLLHSWEQSGRRLGPSWHRRPPVQSTIDRRYTGKLTAAITTGSTSVNVDDVQTITGPDITTGPGETIEVATYGKWEGADNAECRFEYNRSSSGYEFYKIQPSASLVSALVNQGAGVVASDTAFEIDDVEIIAPLGAIYQTGSAPTVCGNVTGLPADDDAPVLAWLDHKNGKWKGVPRTVSTTCPEEEEE